MVRCTVCSVEPIDRHCAGLPQLCYNCCTSSDTTLTCVAHFRQMGNAVQAARLASGRVHPSILEDERDTQPPLPALQPPSPPHPQPPSASDEPQPPAGSHSGARQTSPPRSVQLAPATASALSLAALRAELESDRAAAQATQMSLQAQLVAQSAKLDTLLGAIIARSTAASPSASVPAAFSQPLSSSARSPPHRRAVLDHSAAVDLANSFDALADDASDENEVRTTQTPALLPAAFVPTPSGSEQSAQQQLAAIVSGLSKQGGRVKYSNAGELNEALDDWAADSLTAGWTAAQIESIRAYQRLLINRFTISERKPLKEVLEYHRKWCKAVHAGTINMFVPGAELSWPILYDVSNPQLFGAAGSPATLPHKAAKTRGQAPRTAPLFSESSSTPRHPAGSCVNHPTSTTHTTAQCRQK
jgi:hypothetical protein